MTTPDVTQHFSGLDKKLSLADDNFEYFRAKPLQRGGDSGKTWPAVAVE